jgi:hypothetical protein
LPRAPLGKLFAERLCRFTECFWHSANLLHPVVIVFVLKKLFHVHKKLF